ncbi:hypothetical protein ACIQM3_17855 [Streptomyces sp. NPDC091271]|uniref:hypothetical protein n=1 Tax=Streptomyces sp. NPDC091271 TaxID=3365980 RepID=UPI00380EFDF7
MLYDAREKAAGRRVSRLLLAAKLSRAVTLDTTLERQATRFDRSRQRPFAAQLSDLAVCRLQASGEVAVLRSQLHDARERDLQTSLDGRD